MRVLALRALGIGDLATAVPALRGLRAHYPRAHLALAAPAWLAPLAGLTGAVDSLIPLPGLAAAPQGVPPPEVAVNLHGRGPQSHRLLASLHPGRLLAFRADGYPDGPQWIDDEHEVRRWCRLLDWYGVATDPQDLTLRVPAVQATVTGATIVHPGAKAASRRWPAHRFAEVARRLSDAGHRVVVTGSADEQELARTVCRDAGLPGNRMLAGRLDLAGMAALVAAGRLVVSGDTGAAHLATGYGVPSVVLFGPESPHHWGPPPDRPWHRVLWHPEAPGPALLEISVPEVLAAAEAVCPASQAVTLRRDRSAAVRAESPGSG